MVDPGLVQKCRISQKSMILPISETQCLVVKLVIDNESSSPSKECFSEEIGGETSTVMDDFLGFVCRKSLLHVYRQNRTIFQLSESEKSFVKPPIPYLVNLINHIKLREMIHTVFTDLLMMSTSLYPTLKSSNHAKSACKWIFSLQISKSKKLLITCALTNQTLTLQSVTNFGDKISPPSKPPILLITQLKPALYSIISNYLDEIAFMECKCLFGSEAVCKSTWGIQVFTKPNQS